MLLRSVRQRFMILWLGLYLGLVGNCLGAREIAVTVASGDELTVEMYPGDSSYLIVWLAPEYGFRDAHRALAGKIGEQQIEVWLSNIQESLFLPDSSASIKQLDGSRVADLIEYAHKKTGKKIVLAGDSYASVIALRGAHQWQRRKHPDTYLIGAVLFSPYTYASIPPLGQLPEYLPIVSSTNIPIMIYQADHSAIVGQFHTLLEKLRQHGSPIYTRYTRNIMSLFYEPEPTPQMHLEARALPGNIGNMIPLLEKHHVPAEPVPLPRIGEHKSGIDTYLKVFHPNSVPLPIQLKDLNGKLVSRKDFRGKVTLINFWATWCPPCIEEIPSLNRLQKKMRELPFEIISINYAEDKKAIDAFMKRIPIDFPVLLDPEGRFAQQWKIISYPSTFIIDPAGKIRYGVNAAIEWDAPDVVEKLKALY